MEIRAILKMTNYELTTQKPMHGISLLCGPKQPVQESLYTCLRTIKRAGYLICILTCMGKPLMTMKLDLSDAYRYVDFEVCADCLELKLNKSPGKELYNNAEMCVTATHTPRHLIPH